MSNNRRIFIYTIQLLLTTHTPLKLQGRVSEECRKERRAAVDAGRTGSHWVDKVAVLGAEREEEAALERERHEGMKREGENLGVILSFSEMTEQMRELI